MPLRLLTKSLFIFGCFFSSWIPASASNAIPSEFYESFTMNGLIYPQYDHGNDGYANTPPIEFLTEEIESYIQLAQSKEILHEGETDRNLYRAIERHVASIAGKNVAVLYSTCPWYESALLSYGAFPTAIGRSKIISRDYRINTLTIEELDENPQRFDVIISIASLAQEGLGIYGDLIDPNADLKTMDKIKGMLKKDGLLLLAIPVGLDALIWNSHRVYGNVRLKALFKGWRIVGYFGFTAEDLDNIEKEYLPIFALKPIAGHSSL